MNKKNLYNFLVYLPAIIGFTIFLIWGVLTSSSTTIFILALSILICLILLWERYWINKRVEVKNVIKKS